MSVFIVRVELHDAESKHYATLHEQMSLGGFKTTILSATGVTRSLPTAEYFFEGDLDSSLVLVAACKAANDAVNTITSTRSEKYMVLVTEAKSWRGYGLPPV